jgi:glycosyltransferase involved in cell wall biosynthesis
VTKKLLTVVIPVRNRSGVRLENCLRSLRWQDVAQTDVEIVLSDFGSDAGHLASIRALAGEYDARVVATDTAEIWNRSKVLNIGIQAASADIVLCTDADMIFQPNFLTTVIEAHAGNGGDVMGLCRCHDLPERVGVTLRNRADYPRLKAEASVRETRGTGACQAAAKSFFNDVRGYDEKFRYWGAEDNDMTARATFYGLSLVWVSPTTSMLHQWHRTVKNDQRWRFHLNRLRLKLTKHIVVKNRRGWGTLR